MLGPAAATIGCVGVAPQMEGAALAPPWWHARRRYSATAAPAPVTSAGRSANRSTPGRDTGRGGATGCSAGPRAVTRRRLPPVRNDLQDGEPHTSSFARRLSVRDLVMKRVGGACSVSAQCRRSARVCGCSAGRAGSAQLNRSVLRPWPDLIQSRSGPQSRTACRQVRYGEAGVSLMTGPPLWWMPRLRVVQPGRLCCVGVVV
jgi:hypothetical protein